MLRSRQAPRTLESAWARGRLARWRDEPFTGKHVPRVCHHAVAHPQRVSPRPGSLLSMRTDKT